MAGLFTWPLIVLAMHYYTMGPYGEGITASVSVLLLPAMLAQLIIACVALVGLFLRGRRWRSLVLLLAAVLSFSLSLWVRDQGWVIRRRVIERITANGQPIIEAIDRYTQDHGAPPDRLQQLVQAYLSAIPHTGFNGYPEYAYTRLQPDEHGGNGNPWELEVSTGTGGSFDWMFYHPLRNYETNNDSGGIERIGIWAYVHE